MKTTFRKAAEAVKPQNVTLAVLWPMHSTVGTATASAADSAVYNAVKSAVSAALDT